MAEVCFGSTTDVPGHTSVDVTDVCTIHGPERTIPCFKILETVSSRLRSPQFALPADHTGSHPTNESLELSATGPSILSLLPKPVHFETNWAGSFTKARNTHWPMCASETTTRVSPASYSDALPHLVFPPGLWLVCAQENQTETGPSCCGG